MEGLDTPELRLGGDSVMGGGPTLPIEGWVGFTGEDLFWVLRVLEVWEVGRVMEGMRELV